MARTLTALAVVGSLALVGAAVCVAAGIVVCALDRALGMAEWSEE